MCYKTLSCNNWKTRCSFVEKRYQLHVQMEGEIFSNVTIIIEATMTKVQVEQGKELLLKILTSFLTLILEVLKLSSPKQTLLMIEHIEPHRRIPPGMVDVINQHLEQVLSNYIVHVRQFKSSSIKMICSSINIPAYIVHILRFSAQINLIQKKK